MKTKNKKTKTKIVKFRHRVAVRFFRFILYPFFIIPYRFKYQKNRLRKDGPYLILANHSCALDPLLLSYSFDFPIYFVASEQIFNLGLITNVLTYLVRPISKAKSVADIKTVKEIKQAIKEKGSVGIFVEGNISYTGENPKTPKAIGKLIKHLKVPVILYQMHGLYFSNPRWAQYKKRGKSWGKIKRIIFPAEFNQYTEDELYDLVIENLYLNAYDVQAKYQYRYRGKKRAEGLERFMLFCPVCNGFKTLKSHDHFLTCQKCGSQAVYEENGLLTSDAFNYERLYEFDRWQKDMFIQYLTEIKDDIISEDEVLIWNSNTIPKSKIGMGKISISSAGLRLVTNEDERFYSFNDLQQISIQGKRKIIINCFNGDKYLIDGKNKKHPSSFAPYLYLLSFQYYKYYLEENKDLALVDYLGI